MAVSEQTALVRQVWPLLTVQDVERSVEFYRNRLGFTVVGRAASGNKLFWCRVERGGASIMLQQSQDEDGAAAGRGRGVSLYFLCDDADSLHAELSARGLQLKLPSLAPYGMRQLFVPEPDGYSICFESPTEDWAG